MPAVTFIRSRAVHVALAEGTQYVASDGRHSRRCTADQAEPVPVGVESHVDEFELRTRGWTSRAQEI